MSIGVAIFVVMLAACGNGAADDTTTSVPPPATTTSTVEVPTTPVTTAATTTTEAVVTTTTTPPTTTTTVPPIPLATIEQRVAQEWPGTVPAGMWGAQDAWSCRVESSGPISVGSALTCVPSPEVTDGQHPVLTVLVVDTAGTISVGQAGIEHPILSADGIVGTLGTGQFCRDILGDTALTQQLTEPDMQYFGAVLYWAMEGMPARMDADNNGIPCETLVEADVVDSVWGGAWVEG